MAITGLEFELVEAALGRIHLDDHTSRAGLNELLARLGLGKSPTAVASFVVHWFILVVFLVLRPPFTHAVKVWLLAGFGVLPIGTAASGNIVGYETTEKRTFCGSCHVMSRHESDSEDAHSNSLAARP